MADNTIISLNDVNIQPLVIGGGKFAGFHQLKTLIQRYNAQYKTTFKIPEIIAADIEKGLPDYLNWMIDVTKDV